MHFPYHIQQFFYDLPRHGEDLMKHKTQKTIWNKSLGEDVLLRAKASLTAGIRRICRVMKAGRGVRTGCDVSESRVWVVKRRVSGIFRKKSQVSGVAGLINWLSAKKTKYVLFFFIDFPKRQKAVNFSGQSVNFTEWSAKFTGCSTSWNPTPIIFLE